MVKTLLSKLLTGLWISIDRMKSTPSITKNKKQTLLQKSKKASWGKVRDECHYLWGIVPELN